jgi:hypothetical protein
MRAQVRTIDLGVSAEGSSPKALLSAVADADTVRALEKVHPPSWWEQIVFFETPRS